jgi:hypothetical protein
MRKRLLSMVMALCMVFSLFPTVATAASDVITGQGYEYNTKTKTLTVKEKGGAQRFGGDYYLSYRDECIKAVIQSGVTELGYCEFYMFAALTTVEFPSTITKLDAGAFSQCTSLTEITIPETVTDIGRDTFYGSTALKRVTLPSSLTSVTEAMFEGCTSLETITFNNSNNVTSIGQSAFKGCTNLKSFTIPANVTSIGEMAFFGCSSLGSITIPSKVSSIGTSAFNSCTSLTSAIFQNSMTALPGSIFNSCSNLSSVTLPSNLQTIGIDGFRSCTSLSSINIPSTVTLIDSRAFQECSNLSDVNFASPSVLTTIKDYVFYNCTSLRFITIPSNVTNIGANTFNSCQNLTVVMEPTIAPTLGFAAFLNGKIVKTYVPKNGTGYNSGYSNVIVGNVGLTNLTLSSGELSPAFSFNQYNYTATVPTGTSSITFTPTDLRGETITINGASVASGQASNAITLSGDTITVTIYATYGSTTETYTIEVTKAPAMVDLFTLNGHVTAPVKNITPSTTAIDSAQYAGTVSWKDASENPVSGKFLGGTAYIATVTLTPKKGYTFEGVSDNQFIYSNGTVTHPAGGDGDLVVSIKFPATAARVLSAIAITTPPKTTYEYGETFSVAGMIVKATYDDGTTDNNFTNYTIDKTGSLTPSDTMVTLTAAGTSMKATQPITVAARVLTSIAVTNQPNKMTYKYGETFSKDGMVVTANYKDGGTVNDFKDYTIDKTGPLTMSDTTVTITAGGTAIKTTLNITINRADGPAAPSLTFSFDGSNANKLLGATSLMEYSLDGGLNWSACTNNMTLDVVKISAEKDIKVRIKETETTNAGGIQTIDISPSPAAPSGITATDCTIITNNNGKLSGVSTAMEYKLSTASSWTAVSGNEITGLNNGTYDVRIKATGHTLSGAAAQVTINAYNPATVDKLELDDHVTAPTKNGTPSTTAIETDQYNGTVSWKDTTGAAVSSKFLGGTAYTATVTLTPKYGYTFSGVSANSFTYSNAAVTHSAGSNGDLIVSIAFPATASRELVSITIATQPLKKSYTVGETFDKTGMAITATYDDDTTDSNFTDYTIDKTGSLKSSDSSVTVTANSNTSIFSQQLIEVSKLDRPPAPTVTFSFDGENANKLMGANTSMEYSLDGESNWYKCTENDMDLTSVTITTNGINVRMKETDTTKAGPIQTISISKAELPAATASNATVSGKGTITGVTDKMEYKLSAESTWTRGDGNLISLDPGTYQVRVKATGTVLASDSQVLTIAEFVKGTPTKLDLSYSLTAMVYDGNAKPLSVTAVPDKNLGAITVYYNGETSAPINAGTYEITVDIAGNEEYNDVTALELGDYIIEKANHTGEATAYRTVRTNKAESNLTVALPTDLPEGASYAASGTVGGTAALIDSHSVTGTMLTFSTNSHAAASATITIPVTGAANYNDYEAVVTITAEDKEIVTITGLTADSNLVYNGMPHLGYTGTVTVFDDRVSTDELIYTYTSTDGGTYNSITAPTNAGSYRLVVSVAESNEEFAGEHEAIDFVIQKVSATVNADNKSKIEGELNPVFTFTSSGFVNGESITGVTFHLTGSTITPEGGTVSGGGNENYNITYEGGTLTIRPAQEVLTETISAATTAQNDVIASDKTPGEVPNGQKFVSTALMTVLNTAIADAQQLSGEDSVLDAIRALNNALQAFIDGIQVGTMSTSSSGSSKDSTPAPVTKIESGENVTGINLDNLVKEGKSLTVKGKAGEKLVFGTEALKNIDEQTEDSVKVEIKDVSANHESEHPGKLVVSLTVTAGGKHITNFGKGTVTVSLPYELKEGEKAEDVNVWYLAEDGTMSEIPCTYNPVTELATFKTNHFSLYVVGTEGKTLWTNPFSDVKESSWFYAAVRYVSEKGLMQGTGENSFNPKGATTRGMIVTILWRMENQPKAEKDIAFTDVKNGKYYHDAVAWASEKGIIKGYSAERFAPEENITREQLAVILHNYAASKGHKTGVSTELSVFSDAGKIHSWSKDAMSWANAEGLMNGTGRNLLDPRGNAERCQVAAILQRLTESTVK